MKDILTNEKIVKLIAPNRHAMDNPELLAYNIVFPYEYIPETLEDGATYICYDVDVDRAFDKTYLEPKLYIWVFSHRSQLRLPEGGVRVDKIVSELDNMLNGSRKYTMGELSLYSVKRFSVMSDYTGKQMTFDGTEWNRPKSARDKHTIPANRKNV